MSLDINLGTKNNAGTLDEWGTIGNDGVLHSHDGTVTITGSSNNGQAGLAFDGNSNNASHDGLGLGVVGADNDQIDAGNGEKMVVEFANDIASATVGLASLGGHFQAGNINAKAHWEAYKDGVLVASGDVQRGNDDGDNNLATNSFTINTAFDTIELTSDSQHGSNFSLQYIDATPAEPTLQVDETDLTTSAQDSISFAGSFTNTKDAGTDGEKSLETTFELGVKSAGVDSGLVDTETGFGVELNESTDGSTVTGSVEINGVDVTVFTVTTTDTGLVSLEQVRAMRHPDVTDHNEADAPLTLVDDLITLTRTDVITDNDDDTATDSATLNIGANISFLDDGPSIDATVKVGSTVLDETDTPSATIDATALFQDADYGADGEHATVKDSFSLKLVEGDTGLYLTGDDANADEIKLVAVTDGFEGQTANGEAAFSVTVDSDTGVITVTQIKTLEHGIDGDNSQGEHDDSLFLNDHISVVKTVTDGDGDTASAESTDTLNIEFKDDGPSIDVTIKDVLVSEDFESGAIGWSNNTTTSAGELTNFLGRFGGTNGNQGVSKTFDFAGREGETVTIEFDMYRIDSWDGTGWNGEGEERFQVFVNDGIVSNELNGNQADYTMTSGNEFTGWGSERMNHYSIDAVVDANGQVKLGFGSTLHQSIGDESWGIDNLVISTDTQPTLQVDETDLTADHDSVSFAASFSDTIDAGADGEESVTTTYALAVKAVDTDSGLVDTESGEKVILNVVNGVLEGRTENGDKLVFTVTTDNAGNVSLDQVRAIEHSDTSDHNDVSATITDDLITLTKTVTVEDRDGDTATDSATIDIGSNISFLDDGPVVSTLDGNFTATAATLDESALPADGGDGVYSATVAVAGAFTGAGTNGVVDYGADGAGETTYAVSLTTADGEGSGLYMLDTNATNPVGQGAEITLTENNDGTVSGMNGTTEVFTIEIDGDTGEVTFAYSNDIDPANIWHADTTSADYKDDVSSLDTTTAGALVVKQTIVDGDGDSVTSTGLDIGTGEFFKIEDDGPTAAIPDATLLTPISFTMTNHDHESSAGYNNSYGYYVKDPVTGNPSTGVVVWDNVKNDDTDPVTVYGYKPEEVGFFIIPNGDRNNADLEDGAEVTFAFVGG